MENEQLIFGFEKCPTIKEFPKLRWMGKRPYELPSIIQHSFVRGMGRAEWLD